MFPIFLKKVLKKYHEEEKLENLRYFDPLYDQKLRVKTIKQKLYLCLTRLAKLKLNLQDLTKISSKAFERKGSILFFAAVKERNVFKINELLEQNRLYVFDINNIHQTSLHISCKKGFLDVVKILITNGAEVNAYDLFYRTPLYFSIKYGEIDICRYLLYHKAYPFSSNKCNFEKEMRENPYIHYYIKEARKLYTVLVFVKEPDLKNNMWKEKKKVFCQKAFLKESPKMKKTVNFKKIN